MAETSPATSPDGRSILLVEDNDRFAETLGSELRDRGYDVHRAADLASVDAIPNLDVQYAVVDLRTSQWVQSGSPVHHRELNNPLPCLVAGDGTGDRRPATTTSEREAEAPTRRSSASRSQLASCRRTCSHQVLSVYSPWS